MKRDTEDRDLVYGEVEDLGLVFIDHAWALELAQTHLALRTSRTWGEFLDGLPDDERQFITESFDEDEGDPLDRDAPFDSSQVPAYMDGAWPAWAQGFMAEWIPEQIANAYGKYEATWLGESVLILDPVNELAIVEALQHDGYTCRRDDALANTASGYEWPSGSAQDTSSG